MSNKQLNENHIVNELKGSSLFFVQEKATDNPNKEKRRPSDSLTGFPTPPAPTPPLPPSAPLSTAQEPSQTPTRPLPKPSKKVSSTTTLPHDQRTMSSGAEMSNTPQAAPLGQVPHITSEDNINSMPSHTEPITSASTDASALAREQDRVVDEIRKTIKSYGKEISYVRLTPEEKDLLAEITYTYKRQGVKTSENEINRIAVNFLLNDFKEHGEASILNHVIEALLA